MRKRSKIEEYPSCCGPNRKPNGSLGHHSQILQSRKRKGKHNPIDSINLLIIWLVNRLVFAATSIGKEQWKLYDNLSVFGQIEEDACKTKNGSRTNHETRPGTPSEHPGIPRKTSLTAQNSPNTITYVNYAKKVQNLKNLKYHIYHKISRVNKYFHLAWNIRATAWGIQIASKNLYFVKLARTG